jgi:hypothetical protein
MTVTIDILASALDLEFSLAGSELAEARLRQSHQDTPDHRAAVAECRDRIDASLDMYLTARSARAEWA